MLQARPGWSDLHHFVSGTENIVNPIQAQIGHRPAKILEGE